MDAPALDARKCSTAKIAALADSLRARGIKRIYPFLGPIDREGWPGWRSKAAFVRYDPGRAARFLAEFHRIAPEIRVMPWTGELLDRDVNLKDERRAQGVCGSYAPSSRGRRGWRP